MSSILISEIFYSVQGEGRHVGVPSIFVRVFGCTLQCPGFGGPVTEGKVLPLESSEGITELKQIPIPDVGCDSYPSWRKDFKHLSKKYTSSELIDAIYSLWPITNPRPPHVVFTGGEPLMKRYQLFWVSVFKKIQLTFPWNFTFETNGTVALLPEFLDFASSSNSRITFSVSPKLSNSGESPSKALKPEVVASYMSLTNKDKWRDMYFKFVIRDGSQIEEVEQFLLNCSAENSGINTKNLDVFLMPEGGTSKEVKITEASVAKLCMKYGYKFSPRLHINLFGNAWET